MARTRYLFSGLVLCAIPIWSVIQIFAAGTNGTVLTGLTDTRVNQNELLLLLHVLVVMASSILLLTGLRSLHHPSGWRSLIRFQKPSAWLGLSLFFAPPMQPTTIVHARPAEGVPVDAMLSPSLAAGVLAHILRRRREQIRNRISPDRFTADEQKTLELVQRCAQHAETVDEVTVDLISHDAVVQLVNATERPLASIEGQESVAQEWSIVIKVFGYPIVENESGDIAHFRKRRALELLTWLTMNRDRGRRSAARTAMWDLDVSDPTFSTIVSDMRRGLTELDGSSCGKDWAPATYSDEILLSTRVITDDILMRDALNRFHNDNRDYEAIVQCLSSVRDVPFAGTSYGWADLDGTTTRLVILAITAATQVATWALSVGNMAAFDVAVTAGLRVFPGHEDLINMQTTTKIRC